MTKQGRLNAIKAIFWMRERMEYRQANNSLDWSPWTEDLDSNTAIQQDIEALINRIPDWTSEITVATFDHKQADITSKGLEAVLQEIEDKKEAKAIFKAQFQADVIFQTENERRLALEEIKEKQREEARERREMEELEALQLRQWEALERAQAGLPQPEPTTKEHLAARIAKRRA